MSFESGIKKALDKSAIEELSKIPAALMILIKNATDIKGLLFIESLIFATYNAMLSHGLTWDETTNKLESVLRLMVEKNAKFGNPDHSHFVEILNLINISRSQKSSEEPHVN